MNSDIGYQEKPDIILVHTKNLEILEQTSFQMGHRTFVLICTKDCGYAAVGKNVATIGYLTLARWKIEKLAAVSFCVPSSKSMSIQRVSVEDLLARYRDKRSLWVTVSSTMRYPTQYPVTR